MTTNLEFIRARLAATNPKFVVTSLNGSDRWFNVWLDDELVGKIEGEWRCIKRGQPPSQDGQWTLEGPKVPKLGNKVYGEGSLRRKGLARLLDEGVQYLRGDNEAEANTAAIKEALSKIGRCNEPRRPLASTIVAAMEGEQDAVDELKAFAWQQSIYYRREAARSAMAEMWREDHRRRFGDWPQI